MAKSPPTYVIGRSAHADIVLGDATVSRQHAELVKAKDGTWYLTDRRSTGGTYVQEQGNWVPLRQGFVRPGDRLMLGSFKCSLDDLLRQIGSGAMAAGGPAGEASDALAGEAAGTGVGLRDQRPHGPVRRDPVTGEILPVEDD